MTIHEFRLVFGDVTQISMDDADALYEAGCDDATFGSSGGVAFGDFDREAESLEAAIRSAIRDVQSAGFSVLRVESVGQTLLETINSELGQAPVQ